jgi:argininosuccinate lyase
MTSNSNRNAPKFPAPAYAEEVLAQNFADAQRHFLEPLLFIHYAHAVMLAEQGIIPAQDARRILASLDQLDRQTMAQARYDGTVEDFYFFVERLLIAGIGEETAGKLHIARSRNDIDVTMYRMTLRAEILKLMEGLSALRAALTALAEAHLHTVMPAHTHTQPAQPTTLAHYLSAVIEFLGRDLARLRAAFATVNRSPLGACAITTTGFPINRERTATLLGFEGLAENSYGAIGGIDYLLEAVSALATAMLNLGKFAQDLLLWATRECSFIRLGDAYVQTSSIMPQKRNPVALEHTRILASKAFGQALAVMTSVHNTPFGDVVDVEDDLQPLVFATFADAGRTARLLAAAVGAIEVDQARLAEKAAGSFLTMTELADTLVREEQLSFKAAHRLVAETVKRLPGESAEPSAVVAALRETAQAALGRELATPREKLEAALAPQHFIAVRRVIGGPAPEVVEKFLAAQAELAARDQSWQAEKAALLAAFPRLIESEKAKLIGARR